MNKTTLPTILQLTEKYLGFRYEDNASGDGVGSGIDERPMNNWATLDCTTYVEAVLAQYLSDTIGIEDSLRALRYWRLPPTFLHRNHFIRHDWIPNAIARGFIFDLTSIEFGAERVQIRAWTYDPASWLGRIGKSRVYCKSNAEALLDDLRRQSANLPPRQSIYQVVPLSLLLPEREKTANSSFDGWANLAGLPSGTLLAFFGRRAEHMAWLINESGAPKIRHASRGRRKVREDSLATFLRLHAALGYLDSLSVFEIIGERTISA